MKQHRIQEVQKTISPGDCLLIEKPIDLFYLLEEEFSEGSLIIDCESASLFLDGRYEEVGKKIGLPLSSRNDELLRAALQKYKKINVDGAFCTLERAKALEGKAENLSLFSIAQPLMKWRVKKDAEEMKKMRHVADMACAGYEFLLTVLQAGISEKEVAVKLACYFLEVHKAECAFDPIIAFGENSAKPHAKPGERRLQKGDLVLLDFGAKKGGYCSDMTRTFLFEGDDPEKRAWIEVVKRAQEEAISSLRPGILASELDLIAQKVIEEAGYASGLKHSLGHGIGLEVHEPPILRKTAPSFPIEAGMCVTIEPGIYFEGKGGVRIEDTLFVTPSGSQILTRGSKDV